MESHIVIDKLLTTQQVAEITGWSTAKIRLLIRQGKLPAINSSTGRRALWGIPADRLYMFITPSEGVK